MIKLLNRTSIAMLVVASFGAQVRASYAPDYHVQVGVGPNVVENANSVKIDGSFEASAFYMGDITLSGYTTDASGLNGRPITTINTVCTDVKGTVNTGNWYYYQDVGFSGQSGLDPTWGNNGSGVASTAAGARAIQVAADIFVNHFPSGGNLLYGSHTYTAAEQWAALQLAVWEALYDTQTGASTYGFAGGRFQGPGVSADIQNLALYWDNGSAATPVGKYSGDLLVPLVSNGSGGWNVATTTQEMLFSITAVPEPTTMIAGALLLLPFGASTLRFVRKNRTA
jgi:hypothetical protein